MFVRHGQWLVDADTCQTAAIHSDAVGGWLLCWFKTSQPGSPWNHSVGWTGSWYLTNRRPRQERYMEHQHVGADSESARLRLVYQFRLGHPCHRIRQFYMVLSIRNEGMLCCICVSQTIPFGPSLTWHTLPSNQSGSVTEMYVSHLSVHNVSNLN